MKKGVMLLLALPLLAGICWTGAGAQIVPENHYLVYEVDEIYIFTGDIWLIDQFGDFNTTFVEFDKFANPVQKNLEPVLDPNVHQTWWIIDDPVPPCNDWLVGIENQFGRQDWWVGDGRYLVLPAHKDMAGWPTFWNHYKCYDAIGPRMDITVNLADQWATYTMTVTDPVLFCNPCIKEVFGQHFPIVHPDAHLAVYKLEPPQPMTQFTFASDQFGMWDINVHSPMWLVVPTLKLMAVDSEQTTWGEVKSLYR